MSRLFFKHMGSEEAYSLYTDKKTLTKIKFLLYLVA